MTSHFGLPSGTLAAQIGTLFVRGLVGHVASRLPGALIPVASRGRNGPEPSAPLRLAGLRNMPSFVVSPSGLFKEPRARNGLMNAPPAEVELADRGWPVFVDKGRVGALTAGQGVERAAGFGCRGWLA